MDTGKSKRDNSELYYSHHPSLLSIFSEKNSVAFQSQLPSEDAAQKPADRSRTQARHQPSDANPNDFLHPFRSLIPSHIRNNTKLPSALSFFFFYCTIRAYTRVITGLATACCSCCCCCYSARRGASQHAIQRIDIKRKRSRTARVCVCMCTCLLDAPPALLL